MIYDDASFIFFSEFSSEAHINFVIVFAEMDVDRSSTSESFIWEILTDLCFMLHLFETD